MKIVQYKMYILSDMELVQYKRYVLWYVLLEMKIAQRYALLEMKIAQYKRNIVKSWAGLLKESNKNQDP